ncbi:MAG TPA: ribbon-helix-helix domain-containing protein [Candidatus Bathyarchaeia archaeon]|nr:ribbon-helix-helix domain-containing protein [Candidatus Bathyarchaeia archaeon]
MGIVPVRIDDDQLKRIDLLVKRGVYKTRNQAIREMLKTRLLEELSEDEDVEEAVRVLIETKKKGHEPLVLQLEKSAVETVAEGRS